MPENLVVPFVLLCVVGIVLGPKLVGSLLGAGVEKAVDKYKEGTGQRWRIRPGELPANQIYEATRSIAGLERVLIRSNGGLEAVEYRATGPKAETIRTESLRVARRLDPSCKLETIGDSTNLIG